MTKYKGRKIHSNFSYKNFHPHHSYNTAHHNLYNDASTTGRGFQTAVDMLANTKHQPSIIHGNLTLLGKSQTVVAQLNAQRSILSNSFKNHETEPNAQPITESIIKELTIAVVGSKIKSADYCCFLFTIITSIFIFPLLFMCCRWWKKKVSPLYDLNNQFYQSLGVFLRRNPHCKKVTLTVVDNGFNEVKASLLYSALQGSKVTDFVFLNRALACNYHEKQAESFIQNMSKIKRLAMKTNLVWGDMIV